MSLEAGAARRVITPPRGTYLAGYGQPIRRARDVRDNLYATALALSHGPAAAIWIALDVLAVHEHVAAKLRGIIARRLDIDSDAILIAASHSHSSPVLSTSPEADERQTAYVAQVIEAVADVAEEAWQTREPATLRMGKSRSSVSVNRRLSDGDHVVIGRNEGGPNDNSVTVASWWRPSGTLIASALFFACHPTVLPLTSRRVSAEWPGVARSVVEDAHGGLTLFFQGAAGDIMARHDWFKDDDRALDRIGTQVGRDALDAIAMSEAREVPDLVAGRAEALLPLSVATDKRGAPLGYRKALQSQTKIPQVFADPLLNHMYPWVPRYEEGNTPAVAMVTHAFRMGDWTFVTHGSEPFAATALALKDSIGGEVTFAGYAGGMVGYLPPADEIARGGYEVEPAPYFYRYPGPFAPEAEAAAREATIRLVASLG